MLQHVFPPLELRADEATFHGLRVGLTGFSFGGPSGQTWLRGNQNQVLAVNVNQRDLQFKFEVFALAIDTLEVETARLSAWNSAITPSPPTQFEPWPFDDWRTDVLRRVEFIIEGVDVENALGTGPHNLHSATRPGEAPQNASATCEVAAGLLFTGDNGQRLLIGVDWMPFDLVFTRDAVEIDQFISSCETVEIADYARRFAKAR